ncbi:gamma-glutamyl kinase [Roseovarius salis]|uniref:gamma-glutamyl kinase n=1 Tax=Roseovarius salis TaxID=3376063 RepID=UPI0037CC93CF
MLVFSKARLVFLSVPKTGTTAWQAALEPHAAMVVRDPPELKHAPVFRYNRFFRPALEKFLGGPLTVLAVMREPLDWLGSWYRYRSRPLLDGQPTSTAGIGFDAFVHAYTKGDRPAFANVGSQAKFLEPQKNGTRATHVFRYEDQEGLADFLEDRLGVRVETARHNVSPAMALELSPETRARLRRRCAAEFSLYDSIGENGTYTPQPIAK